MRSTRRTALTGMGLSAIVLGGAPVAAALDGRGPGLVPGQDDAPFFGFSVSPQTVRPGGTVDLTVTDCTDQEATAESAVFERVVLGVPGPTQSARTTVDADARVGAVYDVVFRCGDEMASATLTIADGDAPPSPSPTASPTAKPTRGAQAGGGGTTRSRGDTTLLAAGAGLTAVAAAGGVVLCRRRAGRRGRA